MTIHRPRRSRDAYSLVEVMIAVGLAAILVTVIYTALVAYRVQNRKAQETAVALSFAQSYMELLRNQPYDAIRPGRHINEFYDDIVVPAAGAWASIDTADYLAFHPDLVQIESRNPQLRVAITETNDATGLARAKHINLLVRWNRLTVFGGSVGQSEGAGLTVQLDSTVFVDFK